MTIDKSDFDNWLQNPITKDILESTRARRSSIESVLIYDNSDLFKDRNHHRCLFNKGMMKAYDELLNIRYEDFIQGEENE